MKYKLVAVHKDGREMYAKENCKQCLGRGYMGWKRGLPVPCLCMRIEKPFSVTHPEHKFNLFNWWERLLIFMVDFFKPKGVKLSRG